MFERVQVESQNRAGVDGLTAKGRVAGSPVKRALEALYRMLTKEKGISFDLALQGRFPKSMKDGAGVTVTHDLFIFGVFPTPWPHSPAIPGAPARSESPIYLSCMGYKKPSALARTGGLMPAPPLKGDMGSFEACVGSVCRLEKDSANTSGVVAAQP